MQEPCESDKCASVDIDDLAELYDLADEVGVYGGCFSCGEVELEEAEPYVVSTAHGGKAKIKIRNASAGGGQTDCGECAITVDGPVCSDPLMLTRIRSYIEEKNPSATVSAGDDPVKLVTTAKDVTGCNTEECALRTIARENPSAQGIVADTIRNNFKVDGPADSTKWLNNDNIDKILAQIAKKHQGLYAMPFHMINFARSQGDSDAEDAAKLRSMPRVNLRNISLIKDVLNAGKNMFCVVINTDKYGNPGIHWFCLFCDFRPRGTVEDPFTIEYFNSSGSRARNEIAEWMSKAEAEIESSFDAAGNPRHAKRVTAATVQHQKDTDSECGVYSLYYIWRRVNGASISEFGTRIPDARMIEFRTELYRNREVSPAN
jgi:hypothetical protein